MSQPAHRWAPAAGACGFLLILLTLVWRTRVALDFDGFGVLENADLFVYFYPQYAAREDWLWNPHQLLGIPSLATLQSGVLYPLHLLYDVLPTALGMGVQTFLHLFLGMAFTVSLLRALDCGWVGSCAAAIVFGFSYLLGTIYWPTGLEPATWMPLQLAAIERALGGRRRHLVVLALAVAMPFLAGGYQIAVYALLIAGLYAALGLGELALRTRDAGAVAAHAGWLLLAAVGGVALAAPQILPTTELSLGGARPPQAIPIHQLYPILDAPQLREQIEQALRPPAVFAERYLGAAPLLLAVFAVGSARPRLALFCIVAGAWAALNVASPVWFLELQSRIPVLSWFRLPSRAVGVLKLCLAIAAGIGADRWLVNRGDPRRHLAPGLCAGALAIAVAGLRYPGPLWWLPPALAGLLVMPAPRLSTLRAALAGGLLAFDLAGTTRNEFQMPYVGEASKLPYVHAEKLASLRERAGLDRVFTIGARVFQPEWNLKTAQLHGLYSTSDYEPLAPAAHGDYFEYAARRRLWPDAAKQAFTGSLEFDAERALLTGDLQLLRLLSVRYYIFPADHMRLAEKLRRTSGLDWAAFETTGGGMPVVALEDDGALPRAFGVYGHECTGLPYDAEHALARLAQPAFEPRRSVLLHGACAAAAPPELAPPAVTITDYRPTRVEVEAHFEAPGHLVLTDSHYPGWIARVDGEPADISRANALVRAVRVEPGTHRVVFAYRPRSLMWGGALAASAVGVALACWLALRRKA